LIWGFSGCCFYKKKIFFSLSPSKKHNQEKAKAKGLKGWIVKNEKRRKFKINLKYKV
jgi:hypothetical protein